MKLKRIAAGLAVSGAVAAAMTFGGNQATAQVPQGDTLYGCIFPYYGFIYFVQTSPHNEGACGPGAPIELNGRPADPSNPPPDTGSSLSGSTGS